MNVPLTGSAIVAPASSPDTARASSRSSGSRLDLGGRAGVWVLAAFLAVVAIQHVLWLEHFRSGLPLDIDESGYLAFAFDDLHGWAHSGVEGLYQAVVGQRQFGPLVPLTTTPILGVVGAQPVGAMTVQLGYLAVLAFSTLGLARALVSARMALLLAMVTVALPGVLDYSRTFHLVIASTALLIASVWALVRSNGLQHRRWVIAAGVFTGLMLLARTMTVAFVPGLAISAIVAVWTRPRYERSRSAVNLLLGAGTGLIVAGWWYLPNLSVIFGYLTAYGYGGPSRSYAATRGSALSPEFWLVRLEQLVNQGVYLGVALVIAVTFLLAIVGAARRRAGGVDRHSPSRSTGTRSWTRPMVAFLATPTATITIIVVISYLVLTSSKTSGTGFLVPLVPLIVLMWGCALQVIPWRGVRAALVGALVVAVSLTAVSKVTVGGPLAGPRCVSVPALGCLRVLDGRGVAQQQPFARAWATADPARARRGAPGEWVTVTAVTASFLIDFAHQRGVEPVVFFASRDPLFNTNSVGLAGRMSQDQAIAMGQLLAERGVDPLRNARRHLRDPRFGWPNLLLTVAPGPFEFRPSIDQSATERAARDLGFRLVRRVRLPDGRTARVFWLPRGPAT